MRDAGFEGGRAMQFSLGFQGDRRSGASWVPAREADSGREGGPPCGRAGLHQGGHGHGRNGHQPSGRRQGWRVPESPAAAGGWGRIHSLTAWNSLQYSPAKAHRSHRARRPGKRPRNAKTAAPPQRGDLAENSPTKANLPPKGWGVVGGSGGYSRTLMHARKRVFPGVSWFLKRWNGTSARHAPRRPRGFSLWATRMPATQCGK